MAWNRSRFAVAAMSGLLACSGRAQLGSDDAADSGGPDSTTKICEMSPDASTPLDVNPIDAGALEDADDDAGDAEWGDARRYDGGNSCAPFPCAAGQFCVDTGGASSGHVYCQDIPAICDSTPTCLCLLQAVTCAVSCVADGGAMTATCYVPPPPGRP
jgi:hypothetical protein